MVWGRLVGKVLEPYFLGNLPRAKINRKQTPRELPGKKFWHSFKEARLGQRRMEGFRGKTTIFHGEPFLGGSWDFGPPGGLLNVIFIGLNCFQKH